MTLTAFPLCAQDGCRCTRFHARDTGCPDCFGTGLAGDGNGGIGPCATCRSTMQAQYRVSPDRRARDAEWERDRQRAREAAEDRTDELAKGRL